jgi:GPH family glycoside/pentoside/hexuronide:cation symporter
MKTYTGEKLPLWREILYGGGNFTASMFGTIIGTWLSFFYIDTLGFNAKAIGIAMIVYSVWNAVNDPIMGYVSDRTRTKFGRRLPYVLFGAIPLGISFILIFSPPTASLTSSFSQILYYTLSLCVYDFFFTTVLLNWEAVVPDMYPKEKDRGRIIGIAQICDILGGVVASIAIQPVFEAYGWEAMAIIFGCIGAVVMFLTVFGIRENPKNMKVQPLNMKESIKETFKNRSFRICVFSVFCVEAARLLLLASVPYYAKYAFPGVDMAATIISAIVFVSGLIFTPVALAISKRIGVKKAYIMCLICFAVVACGFFFCRSFIFCIILSVLMGLGVTGGLIMPKLLNTEIIDEDQTITGRRREGAFYGMSAFVLRFAAAIETLILTGVMRVSGYVEGAASQVAGAEAGFRVTMSFIPAALIIIGVLIFRSYPLSGERLAEVKARIAQMENKAAQTE